MTSLQAQILRLMKMDRPMTLEDVKAAANRRGQRLGKDDDIKGALRGLIIRGVVSSETHCQHTAYTLCREAIAARLAFMAGGEGAPIDEDDYARRWLALRTKERGSEPPLKDQRDASNGGDHEATMRRILEVVSARPGINSLDVASLTGTSTSYAQKRLGSLHKAGQVLRHRDNQSRPYGYTIAQEAAE